MGIMYTICVDLKAEVNKKNVTSIIKNAVSLDCSFYKIGTYDPFNPRTNNPLSLEQTISHIVNSLTRPQKAGAILAVIKQTDFVLTFYTDKELDALSVDLSLISGNWVKEFSEGEESIDFARYINFLLEITQDHPIYNIGIKYE